MTKLITIDPLELDHAMNPSARVPVAILADVSTSMAGVPIAALQHGLRSFFCDIEHDPLAQLRCDPTVFTFGGVVKQVMPWEARMVADTHLPELRPDGNTPLGEAVRTAMDAISKRQAVYRAAAIQSYKPWVVILTDGRPTDDWEDAAASLAERVLHEKWNVICVATGPAADVQCLKRFSPEHAPLIFRDQTEAVGFSEFFRWLSSSIRVTSRKATGSAVHLAPLPSSAVITDI